jgi:flagellar biosynthetic protein FliP
MQLLRCPPRMRLRRSGALAAIAMTAMLALPRPVRGEWMQPSGSGSGGSSGVAAQSFWVTPSPHAAVKAAQTVQPAQTGKTSVGKQISGAGAKQTSSAVPAAKAGADDLGLNSIASQLNGGQSVPWSIVIGLTLLTLLPALLLSMTPMVRLLVVFHFLRQALGTQTAPSNQVLMGLGLMMTWFLMQPVMVQVDQQALAPYRAGTITGEQALELGEAPVKTYMLRYAREKDLALFASAGMTARPKTAQDLPMQVVVPAYMLSELKAGFQIGAVLFLPFLLVDLAIASITTSVGMMQLPPVVISTPVKILLFVMVDGWNLLASSLLKSF